MQLLPEPKSVAIARRHVGSSLLAWGGDPETEVAVLLTSELVTNAVVHGGPHSPGDRLLLDIDLNVRRVRIEVHDNNRGAPALKASTADGQSGRGVLLVELLASSWGVTPRGLGKTVWFEVERSRMTDDFVGLDRQDRRIVVTVRGELDIATAPDVEKVLIEAGAADLPVFVDVTEVTFLDSTGLKFLVRSARQLDGRFTLVCPVGNRPVMRVVGFAGFEQAFPVVESL